MPKNDKRAERMKKLDVLYIIHNPLICLAVYFSLCFTWVHIINDIFGQGQDLGQVYSYIIPMLFAIVMGIGMYRWAKKAAKDTDLDQIH